MPSPGPQDSQILHTQIWNIVIIISFRTDRSESSSLSRLYTVCHSVSIIWTHYSMVNSHSLAVWIFTIHNTWSITNTAVKRYWSVWGVTKIENQKVLIRILHKPEVLFSANQWESFWTRSIACKDWNKRVSSCPHLPNFSGGQLNPESYLPQVSKFVGKISQNIYFWIFSTFIMAQYMLWLKLVYFSSFPRITFVYIVLITGQVEKQ